MFWWHHSGVFAVSAEAIAYGGLVHHVRIWFGSSRSFANPAVMIGRSFSDTFAGIRPEDAPMFILVQIISAIIAALVFSWFASV